MRKSIYTLLALTLVFGSKAQDSITIKKHLLPKLGYKMPVSYSLQSLDNNDLKVIYDFSSRSYTLDLTQLTESDNGFDEFKKPADVYGGAQIKGADYGFEYRYGSGFFKNNNDAMLMVGFTPNLNLQFPLTFQFDSTVTFIQSPVAAGDTFIDSTTSLLQIPFFYDIKAKMTNKYVAIDNGKIKFPNDSIVDVLRLRRELVFYAIANDLINKTVDTLADTLVTWEFYAQGFKSTVLRAEFQLIPIDSFTVDTMLFLTYFNDQTVSTQNAKKLEEVEIQYFGNQLNVNSETATQIRLVSLSGQELLPFGNGNLAHTIDLSALPKGAFIVQVQSKTGYTSQVFVR